MAKHSGVSTKGRSVTKWRRLRTVCVTGVVAMVAGYLLAALTLSSSGAAAALPRLLAGCFGHQGVQFSDNNAYECVAKTHGEGGALYWQRNNNDYEWNLHPDKGNLTINAITFPLGHQNPYYGFTAVVDSGRGGCQIVGAGYDQHPTTCRNPGKRAHKMDARQQRSYDDFAEVMNKEIPGCAWQPAGTKAKTC